MPLVSSVSSQLKKYVSTTQVVTPEEVKESKKNMLSTVNRALELFNKNLIDGKVEMTSSIDLDRLVKLNLLLSGEADSISGNPINVEEHLDDNVLDGMLDENDPTVKELYGKIFTQFNQINDKEE